MNNCKDSRMNILEIVMTQSCKMLMQQASPIRGFEEVNQFLKNFKRLEMKHRHENATLVGCVYVACKLYMEKKEWLILTSD